MLEKCLVGVLVSNNLTQPSSSDPLEPPSTPPVTLTHAGTEKPKIADLDFYQSNDSLTVVLYTKMKSFKQEFLIIEKSAPLTLAIFVYILENVYKYSIGKVSFV